MQREQQFLLELIPEWKDETTRNKEFGEIQNELRKRGYAANELQLEDSRTLKLLKDLMFFKQKYENTTARVAQVKKVAKRPAGRKPDVEKPSNVTKIFKAAMSPIASEEEKFSAMDELLRGG